MIAKAERRWIWWFGLAAVLITTLPYWIGFTVQGTEWRYSGLLLASEDGYSYLAKMLLGSNGDWLFRTPYTGAAQSGFLAFLPYILLGKLAGGAGRYEQLAALFHIFRISGVFAAVWATYDFMALFVAEVGRRRLGTALAIYGGGLGFLVLFGLGGLWQGVMKLPLEFYSPEAFGFLSLLALPHLAWGRALLLWGMGTLVRQGARRAGIRAGGIWLMLGLMQPLTVVSAWAVEAAFLGGWGLLLWRRKSGDWKAWRLGVKNGVTAVLISSPWVIYNFSAFQLDPFLKQWQARNLIPSPPLGDYLLAYALLLPLAGLALWKWRTALTADRLLPIVWLAIFPLLAYAPYNLQRRLPEGIWVAICALGMAGLSYVPQRWIRAVQLGVGLVFLTPLVFYLGLLSGVSHPMRPLFRPAGEILAAEKLGQLAEKNAVVLAAYDTSTLLPAHAAVRVLIGHGPESLNLEKISPRVEAFFSPGESDSERRALVQEFGIDYVFYGPLEKALGAWDPGEADFLIRVYQTGEYSLFRVAGGRK